MGNECLKFSSADSSKMTENARSDDTDVSNAVEPAMPQGVQKRKRKPRGIPMRGGYRKLSRRTGPHNPPVVIDGSSVLCAFEETSNEVTIWAIADQMEMLMAARSNHVAA